MNIKNINCGVDDFNCWDKQNDKVIESTNILVKLFAIN